MLEIRRTESRPDRDGARPLLKRRPRARPAAPSTAPAEPPATDTSPPAEGEPRHVDVVV